MICPIVIVSGLQAGLTWPPNDCYVVAVIVRRSPGLYSAVSEYGRMRFLIEVSTDALH